MSKLYKTESEGKGQFYDIGNIQVKMHNEFKIQNKIPLRFALVCLTDLQISRVIFPVFKTQGALPHYKLRAYRK